MSGLEKLDIRLLGTSHGDSVDLIFRGIPAGEAIDPDELQTFVNRRRSVDPSYSTPRSEPDTVTVTGGITNGVTDGTPITATIPNTNRRRGDYDKIATIPRPSHADYPAFVRYGGKDGSSPDTDMSGGGKFSGRLTAPYTVAGGIAVQILRRRGVTVGGYVRSAGGVVAPGYADTEITRELLNAAKTMKIPLLDPSFLPALEAEMRAARNDGDSVGGVIECAALGVPVGLGDTHLSSIESRISALMFAIPAVKGIEFGDGFALSAMRGSAANDGYRMQDGKVTLTSNHNGGILGGLATGAPILCRVAVKPTPTISLPQPTVDLATMTDTVLIAGGRHDACIVPRAAVVAESAMALALLDCFYSPL